MRFRVTIATAAAVGVLALGGAGMAEANSASGSDSSTFCTWGGTPAAPTGTFTLTPGVRQVVPASEPLTLYVTGELSGGGPCQGKMVFKGVAEPGATCPEVVFDGKVEGVPGVDHFWGAAVGGLAQEFLYDSEGRIVGSDQPQVISSFDHFTDCLRPEGLTEGNFSSTVELFGQPIDPNQLQPSA
jgi:hypothetical protein